MRLFVVMPAVVLAACSVVIGMAWISGGQAAAARRAAEPRTGMDILNAHTCGRGETKRIIVRGVEDDYSPAGEEPGFIREGRSYAAWLPRDGTGEYDQVNADRGFTDSFNVKGPVSGGIFLFRARGLNGSDNDTFNMGDMTVDPDTGQAGATGGKGVLAIRADAGWSIKGDIQYANIEDIPLYRPSLARTRDPSEDSANGYTLKSYLNDASTPQWLDVFLQDDTVLDFMGLALCSPPTVKRGVTLMPNRPTAPEKERRSTVHLTCHIVEEKDRRCEPYVGDTDCSTELPVACLRPGDAPAPVDAAGNQLYGAWSGGEIAVTEAVRGDRFPTVGDVEAFCARRFGPGWRVAALHDGYRYQSISGLGNPETINGRVWVDIADQPNATCWARQ